MDKRVLAVFAALIVVLAAVGVALTYNAMNRSYDITYDYNYENSPESEVISYKNNTKLTETHYPDNQRRDHVFGGWYYDKECTKLVVLPYTVTGNTTWYANWIEFHMEDFVNKDFLNTPYGQYLVNSKKATNTATEITDKQIADFKRQFVSNGLIHAVFHKDSGTTEDYSVYSLQENRLLYSIQKEIPEYASIVDSVTSISLDEFNYEFIKVKLVNGAYLLFAVTDKDPITGGHGKYWLGPSVTEPELILNKYVIFDGKCYSFEKEGTSSDADVDYYHFKYECDVTSTHRPVEEGNGTFNEIEYDADGNAKRVNILNGKFDVIKTYEFPKNSHRAVCFHTDGNSYLVQYSMPTNDSDYTYKEDGVKYKLVSFILRGDSNSKSFISLGYLAFAATDMTKLYHFKSMYATDIKNVISFYTIDSEKNLKLNGKILLALDKDGNITKSFSISLGNYSFAMLFPTTVEDRFYIWNATADDKGSLTLYKNIVDSKANIILSDVVVANCAKYFVREAADDNNIYDINANVVGSYEGKTLVDCTNNILFFKDADGNMYKFSDGKMSKLDDYKGDLVVRQGYYGYKVGENSYKFFTESGNLITESTTKETRERISANGQFHFAEFYLGGGQGFKLVRLSSA